MSEYTRILTAEQLIAYIARDYVEQSHEKVLWQRNDHMNICREWLEYNDKSEVDEGILSYDQVDKLVDDLVEKHNKNG